jgi:hypothetical protein
VKIDPASLAQSASVVHDAPPPSGRDALAVGLHAVA